MSNWAGIVICILIAIGMLFLIVMTIVTIVDTVQDMRRKKIEWEREDKLRGWSEDQLRKWRKR